MGQNRSEINIQTLETLVQGLKCSNFDEIGVKLFILIQRDIKRLFCHISDVRVRSGQPCTFGYMTNLWPQQIVDLTSLIWQTTSVYYLWSRKDSPMDKIAWGCMVSIADPWSISTIWHQHPSTTKKEKVIWMLIIIVGFFFSPCCASSNGFTR